MPSEALNPKDPHPTLPCRGAGGELPLGPAGKIMSAASPSSDPRRPELGRLGLQGFRARASRLFQALVLLAAL